MMRKFSVLERVLIGLFFLSFVLLTLMGFMLNESQGKEDVYKKYASALGDISVATNLFDASAYQLYFINYYTFEDGYSYDFAMDTLDFGRIRIITLNGFLNKSEEKLLSLENSEFGNFFKEDIENRLIYIRSLREASENLDSLIQSRMDQVYEMNYGSESKAMEFNKEYNVLTEESVEKLKNLDIIQKEIDEHWETDWYPEYNFE